MSAETFPLLRWKRLSENLNVTIGGSSFYTGSVTRIDGYVKVRAIGEFSGSAQSLGVQNKVWLSISNNSITWNPWFTGSVIVSGSAPVAIVVDCPSRFARVVLENLSGSSLSGSAILEAFFEA